MATPLRGYLGAGKTTLLNRLLMQGAERILVMVSDFGAINVDAALVWSICRGRTCCLRPR